MKINKPILISVPQSRVHGTSIGSRYAQKIEIDCRKEQNQSEDFIMFTVNKPHVISVFIVGKTLYIAFQFLRILVVLGESGIPIFLLLSWLLNQPRSQSLSDFGNEVVT